MNEHNNPQYLVYVECFTYNHAKYIENTLNGFCIQQTNFPFVCIIVDDASTDGEQNVIKAYLEDNFDIQDQSVARNEENDDYFLIFARHKKNKNCYFATLFLKYNHYSIGKLKYPYIEEWTNSKYVALCEGDDYWIDSQKLQKQVAFLEKNQDYVLCYSDAYRYDIDKKRNRGRVGLFSRRHNVRESASKQELFYKVLDGYYYIQTLTVLYRRDAVIDRPVEKKKFMMGDTNLWLYLSQKGKFHYFDECFGVYNIHIGSATHSKDSKARFSLSMFEMRCYYCEESDYIIPERLKRQYNRALFNIILSQGEIIPPPIYPPFRMNSFQWFVIQQIIKKGTFYRFYRYIIHPIEKNLFSLASRLEITIRVLSNLSLVAR